VPPQRDKFQPTFNDKSWIIERRLKFISVWWHIQAVYSVLPVVISRAFAASANLRVINVFVVVVVVVMRADRLPPLLVFLLFLLLFLLKFRLYDKYWIRSNTEITIRAIPAHNFHNGWAISPQHQYVGSVVASPICIIMQDLNALQMLKRCSKWRNRKIAVLPIPEWECDSPPKSSSTLDWLTSNIWTLSQTTESPKFVDHGAVQTTWSWMAREWIEYVIR